MEVQFSANVHSCLRPALWETCSREETQEIRLSDGMPDVGRVICAWGQCILRSKEWNPDHISCSAGMMVWVLYAPDDGSEERVVHCWIPFQLRWELPEGTREGTIRLQCLPKQTDARSLSPRKILVRSAMTAQVQALVPEKLTIPAPAEECPEVQLLKQTYPVQLLQEAGEKTFSLDETIALPESAPVLEKVIYQTAELIAQETKVVTDKLVFRGNLRLHVLYRSEAGQLHSWDFAVPFSQYTPLEQAGSPQAQPEVMFCVTNLELEREEKQLRLKCAAVCQYAVWDQQLLELTADAYSNTRELSLEKTPILLYPELERRREMLHPEQGIPVDANVAVDVQLLPEFPRQRREEAGVRLVWPGQFQMLYYAADGSLRSGSVRWETEKSIPMDGDAELYSLPEPGTAQAAVGNGAVTLQGDLPVCWNSVARQTLTPVSSLSVGDRRKPDPDRPSLLLRRAGAETLWELAKDCGSTVEAIRKANQLTGEPEPRQMLLIPVP